MSITRLIFYLFNHQMFANLSFGSVISLFFYGLRFDLATVFLFNIVFIVLSVVPDTVLKYRAYQVVMEVLFITVNSLLIATNLIDTKFYIFEGKRLTGDIFTKEWLGKDLVTLLPQFLKDYWYLYLMFVLCIAFFIWIYPKYKSSDTKPDKQVKFKFIKQLLIAVVLLVLSVYAGRGGTQLKPLGIIAAARYTTPEFIPLILNSPFTIIKTLGNKSLPNQKYFPIAQIDSVYSPVHHYHHKKFRNKNVVIIILESFGRDYSGFLNDTIGYMPNLDSIMQRGLTFTHAFANGKRSIEALPSILSSVPALMDNAFVNTKFSSNSIEGLGQVLVKEGYQTAFYHGGKNGTMGFDNFVNLVGFQKYYGMDEYPDKSDYDGNWGIYDEPYLQYFANQLSRMQQPFLTAVFTLSSHHPYMIPEKYQGRFPKGDLENLESIGYADYALGEFFKTASKMPWFKNTLFVLTADHTSLAHTGYYQTNVGKYAVPLVFYAPGDKRIKGVSNLTCQQADILPSVLDYLGYNEPFNAFGKSVFSSDSNRFAVNYISGIYQLINTNCAISFDGSKVIDTLFFKTDTVNNYLQDSLHRVWEQKAENNLKAYIQQYNFRMEHNLMKFHGKLSDIKKE